MTALLLSLPAALFPALGLDLDREATEALKLWLLLGAALLVALGRALPRRWGTGLLCALPL